MFNLTTFRKKIFKQTNTATLAFSHTQKKLPKICSCPINWVWNKNQWNITTVEHRRLEIKILYPIYRHQKLQFPVDFSILYYGFNYKELIPTGLIELFSGEQILAQNFVRITCYKSLFYLLLYFCSLLHVAKQIMLWSNKCCNLLTCLRVGNQVKRHKAK